VNIDTPEPPNLKPVHGVGHHERFLDDSMSRYYWDADFGKRIRDADDYFRQGDFQRALYEYRQAFRAAKDLDWTGVDTQLLGQIDDFLTARMRLARQGLEKMRELTYLQKTAQRLKVDRIIAKADDFEQFERSIIDAIENKPTIMKSFSEPGANPIYEIEFNGEKYLFKFEEPSPLFRSLYDIEKAIKDAQDECAATDLYNAVSKLMGTPDRAPAACVVTMPGKFFGKPDFDKIPGILMRKIDGIGLNKLTEPEILAHHAALARQRIFRAWVGDSDPHMKNLIQAIDGQLCPIDFGKVSFDDLLKQAGMRFDDPKEYVREALKYAHTDRVKNHPLAGRMYQYVCRLDDMMHPEIMDSTIEAINKLAHNRGAMEKIFGRYIKDSDQLGRVIDKLKARAEKLRPALKEFVEETIPQSLFRSSKLIMFPSRQDSPALVKEPVYLAYAA
jgi:hypothetical protein